MIVKLLLLGVICLALSPLYYQKAEEDSKMIEGNWIPITAELAGQRLPDETLKDTRLILGDGRYTYQNDHGSYTLAPSEKPKAMEITGKEGPNQGKTFLAIYELTDDTLRICYDLSGKTRPTEFTTKAGTRLFLVTYKRVKN